MSTSAYPPRPAQPGPGTPGQVPRGEPRPDRRHGAGFWLIAAALLAGQAFSTAPAPLYPLYQQRDHFSTFMVTLVFAALAAGVVVSLLLAGHVSDWVGRKRILIPAIALEAVASLMFLIWPDLPVLLAGRFVNGLGVGMITATATAHLHELHARHRPDAAPTRFEIVSTAANIGGLGFGPLLTGVLAQYAQQPLRLPFAVFTVLLLLALVAVAFTPETVEERPVRPAWRPQRVRGHGGRTPYLIAAGGAFTSFAVFGLFNSLAAGFVAGTLHHPGRLLAGVTVFLVFAAASVSQAAAGRTSPLARNAIGLGFQAAGLVMLVVAMNTVSLGLFFAGGAVAGAGAGVLFKSAVGAVTAAAPPTLRGEALAGLFLIAYLGMIVPSIGMGIATEYIAATTAMAWFTGLLLILMAATTALLVSSRRRGWRAAVPG